MSSRLAAMFALASVSVLGPVDAARADGLAWFAEATAMYGPIDGEYQASSTERIVDTRGVLDLRAAFGLSFPQPTGGSPRVAVVADLFSTGTDYDPTGDIGLALGVEGQIDWAVYSCWRAGVRLAQSLGEGNGTAWTGDGNLTMLGVRARNHLLMFGMDVFVGRGGDEGGKIRESSGIGVLFGAGIAWRR